ncbi:MAG: tetratricopeptide repeat protein [Chromatiales bacterium]|nr:tetratricopeptide repeat protein [Chromatiales bacterium]
MSPARIARIVLLVAFLLTIAVYIPGLAGGFAFDDHANIVDNPQLKITQLDPISLAQAAGSAVNGERARPISMLTFGINHAFTGIDPWWLKTTNLAIHLINGVLIYLLATGLIEGLARRTPDALPTDDRRWITVGLAAAWLLHPYNLTPVLYVVQRMASLSTLFMLGGLVLYVNGRLRMLSGRQRSGGLLCISGIAVMTPLAYLAKENGILLPLLAWSIEFVVFRFQDARGYRERWLIWTFIATVALPAMAGLLWFLFKPSSVLDGYNIKPFGFIDRILTEPRVLWHYVGQILLPRLHGMGVYNDDVVISKGAFTPWSTLPAIVAWLLAVLLAFRFHKRWPIPAFAVLFFLAGHALESTVLALLLAQDHRNYLPSFSILLLLAWILFSARLHPDTARLRRAGGITMIALFAGLTLLRSLAWSSPLDQAINEVTNHPNSPRAHNLVGGLYARAVVDREIAPELNRDQLFDLASTHLRRAADLLPTSIVSLSSLALLHASTDRPLPDGLIDEVIARLSGDQVDVDHLLGLSTLASVSSINGALIPGTLLEFMYETALANPAYPRKVHAILLTRYARILLDHDLRFADRAIELMHQAIELRPKTLQFRVNLAVILMSMNRLAEAERELDAAEALDPFHTIHKQLATNRGHLRLLQEAARQPATH